jgi:formate hydrogenlyase subunit 6/NADH:ubiquinone oxidoreductase subunit I
MRWKIDLKGELYPFSILKYWFKHPHTIKYPYEEKRIPEGYRGLHTNNLTKCIGCGQCQDICMNESIDMIEPPKDKEINPKNVSGLIPRIDYGRCCWCALCEDVCPVNSLVLTKDFIYVSEDPDSFLHTPGVTEY